MRNSNKQYSFLLFILFSFVLLSGCAGTGKNMDMVSDEQVVNQPDEGNAMVVFMRPSSRSYAIRSSVFEITDSEPALVGILAYQKKVAYQTKPGNHLFMVVGESGDFMSADLEANKTYYALVTPRMGAWKTRFSLKPISAVELDTPQFANWYNSSDWVAINADSENWAQDKMSSIQAKYDKYHPKWMTKDVSQRPHLNPEDGQ